MFACLSEPLGLVWPRPDVVVHVAVGHPRRARKPMRGAIGVAPPGRTEASPDDANRVGRSASAGRELGGASVDATTRPEESHGHAFAPRHRWRQPGSPDAPRPAWRARIDADGRGALAPGVGLGPRMMFEHGRRRGLPHRLPRHACRVVIGHFLATRRRHEGVGPRVHLALPVVLIGIGVLILVEGRRLRTLGTSVRTSAMRVRLLASLNHPGNGTHLVSGSRCTKWWPPSRREPGLRGS